MRALAAPPLAPPLEVWSNTSMTSSAWAPCFQRLVRVQDPAAAEALWAQHADPASMGARNGARRRPHPTITPAFPLMHTLTARAPVSPAAGTT